MFTLFVDGPAHEFRVSKEDLTTVGFQPCGNFATEAEAWGEADRRADSCRETGNYCYSHNY